MLTGSRQQCGSRRGIFVVGVLSCLFCLIAQVHAQQAVLWNIDSSTAFEDRSVSNTELRLILQTPGGDYASQGAAAGTSLFEGERDGASVSGIAWNFIRGCAPESYEITGSLSADGQAITLKGRAPIRDSTCRITSYQDKTLVFTKRSAAASLPAAPPATTVPAAPNTSVPGRSYWAHNGSTIYLVAKATSRELYYDKPRPSMIAAGARPGSLLFRGTYGAGNYSGTAFIFNKRCGTLPYQVSGPVTNDFEKVTMYGQAPSPDASCNVSKYVSDTLEFALCEKSPPPGSNALICP